MYRNLDSLKIEAGCGKKYLASCGVEDVEGFINPSFFDYEDPFGLDNMKEMVESLHEGFTNNKNFFVQVDSDTDGITSAAIFINFFRALYPNAKISWRMHDAKEHGVILDTVPIEADYVIIPDAGSNQHEEHRILTGQGRKVLVIDHHLVTHVEPYEGLIIVNNQGNANFKNEHSSGAGVVYKVIEAFCRTYPEETKLINFRAYEDLAAIGIVADMMDLRDRDNNIVVYNGLRNIKNPMLKAIIKQNERSISGIPTRINVGWNIAPFINGVIRIGTKEEKDLFFRAFVGERDDEIFHTEWRGEKRQETLYEYAARMATNLKAKQDREKKKGMALLDERIKAQGLDKNSVIVVETSKTEILPTITGLVAMELANTYNRPTLVLRPSNDNGTVFLRGSARSLPYDSLPSFSDALLETGLMDYCAGHDNAFGASFKKDDLANLIEAMNKRMEGMDLSVTPKVVQEVSEHNWSSAALMELAQLKSCYGNTVPEPKLGFKIIIEDYRVMGAKGDSVRISYKGTNFVGFKCTDLINKIDENFGREHDIQLTLISTASLNEFNGNVSLQVMFNQKDVELELVPKKVRGLF